MEDAKVEIGCHERIAGALFDFLGYLTTLPEAITLGAAWDAGAGMAALSAWAASRGLTLTGANVQEWQQEDFLHAILQSDDMPPAQKLRWFQQAWGQEAS